MLGYAQVACSDGQIFSFTRELFKGTEPPFSAPLPEEHPLESRVLPERASAPVATAPDQASATAMPITTPGVTVGTASARRARALLGFAQSQCRDMDFLTKRTGLTVISGPTGHGKSTVLKHTMESQTETAPEKAYHSVEDPPEFHMRDVNQIKVTTKQEGDYDRSKRAAAYINVIAGAMRSDSDVLMIGEIRYPEAAVAAIDAALTGQSVWATLHANNGFGIVTRFESLLRSAGYLDPLDVLCDPNVLPAWSISA